MLGDIDNYADIYVWGSHFSLGISLAENNVHCILCEDAAGLLSRPEIVEAIDANDTLKSQYYSYIKNLGLYDASAECAKGALCNVSAQNNSFQTFGNIIDFNVTKKFMELPEEQRNQIISFFLPEKKDIAIGKDTTILLTQHFANLKVLSFEQQILIYQLFVDYFLDNTSLVIKPHPDDLMYYSQLFPCAKIVREKFPSEFMPVIFNHQPKCIATISSTAIYNLRESYPKIIELDSRFEKDFGMIHRYFAAVKMAQKLNMNIACLGANEVLARCLCDTLDGFVPSVSCKEEHIQQPCVLLVDDVTEQEDEGRIEVQTLLQTLDSNSCVIFINSKEDYCWYDYELRDIWTNIVPVSLKKRILENTPEDFYASLRDEILYVYSKNEELLTMAKNTVIDKELLHTGISIENNTFTPEQERIKMLEGILAATEKRLLYYIEKEREQK